MTEVNKDILKEIYKERPKDSKKYDFGLMLVIGGSECYSGSPALNAFAGFRTGVDMVRIIAPKRAADIIASFSPILATHPLEGKWLEKKHLASLITITESAKISANGKVAVTIGGGLGRTKETLEAVIAFLEQVSVPVVVDADAIHALAIKPQIAAGKNFLITPHTYEFFVLTGKEIRKLPEAEKIKMVQEEAARLQATILLKGPTDIISNGKEVVLDRSGSPYMTKGGCGDTLAGIAGALLARGVDVFTAAQAATYINGKAGEIASQKMKESMTPMELIEAIPEVIR